jgi:hypothetical protein
MSRKSIVSNVLRHLQTQALKHVDWMSVHNQRLSFRYCHVRNLPARLDDVERPVLAQYA